MFLSDTGDKNHEPVRVTENLVHFQKEIVVLFPPQAKHSVEKGSPLGVCSLDPDPATGQIVRTAASIEVICR